jgi:hypothetical protein
VWNSAGFAKRLPPESLIARSPPRTRLIGRSCSVASHQVLEHVPPALAQQSVDELVRCAKRHVLATISLRASALDVPGKPPKVRQRQSDRATERQSESGRVCGCRLPVVFASRRHEGVG